jgi:hypothetical protein
VREQSAFASPRRSAQSLAPVIFLWQSQSFSASALAVRPREDLAPGVGSCLRLGSVAADGLAGPGGGSAERAAFGASDEIGTGEAVVGTLAPPLDALPHAVSAASVRTLRGARQERDIFRMVAVG